MDAKGIDLVAILRFEFAPSALDKLFFFHLPKSGGTSISSALAARFEPSLIAPLIENDVRGHRENQGCYEQFRGYDFYSGHYGRDIFEAVSEGHFCIGNFRHPVNRIYSLYRYFRNLQIDENVLAEHHYAAVRMAKRSTLAEFIASDDQVLLTYTSNQHARQLTRSPWTFQRDIDLDAAIETVDAMTWFYVCELQGESLEWLGTRFQIEGLPILNTTPEPALPDEVSAVAESILDRNRIDLALYNHATSRLHAQRL